MPHLRQTRSKSKGKMVQVTCDNGFFLDRVSDLQKIVFNRIYIFRTTLLSEPSADVAPLRIDLVSPAEKVRVWDCYYFQVKKGLLFEMVEELVRCSNTCPNPSSPWASGPFLGPIMVLQSSVARSTHVLSAGALPNAKRGWLIWPDLLCSQHMTSIMGSGSWHSKSPLRSVDCSLHPMKLFLYLCPLWDDKCGYVPAVNRIGQSQWWSSSIRLFIAGRYFCPCWKYRKSFCSSSQVCPTLFSDKIRFDSCWTNGLPHLKSRATGAHPQQIVWVTQWMRHIVLNFSTLIMPFLELLEFIYSHAGKCAKSAVGCVHLSTLDWCTTQEKTFRSIKDALNSQITLAHCDASKVLYVYIDESDLSWTIIVTQVWTTDVTKPLGQNHHLFGYFQVTFRSSIVLFYYGKRSARKSSIIELYSLASCYFRWIWSLCRPSQLFFALSHWQSPQICGRHYSRKFSDG